MRRSLPLAFVAALAAFPAIAQQSLNYPGADGLQQAELAPVQDVVVAVEQRLAQLGYSVTPDGQFDADLRNSVMLFQSNNGLRPTGNVDLTTLAALGVNVDPAGRAAIAQQPVTRIPEQTAGIVDDNSPDFPLFKDEHMSAPMISIEEGNRFENQTGVPQPRALIEQGDIPGLPPGFPEENLVR
jgi:peptidoglycan hydrolase-like protein with peptidoglycan-binding domain